MFAASWNEPSFDAPSPKNATATFFVFLNFCVNAAPTAIGEAAADDAVGAEHAEFHVADVHAAALAFAVAGRAAEQLGEHAIELAAFRDEVAVPAVRAGDLVVGRQMGAHADRHGLGADVGVHETRHVAAAELAPHALLEPADTHHRRQRRRDHVGLKVTGAPPVACERASASE